MFIFDQISGKDFSGIFVEAMDQAFFEGLHLSSDELLTYFYFM